MFGAREKPKVFCMLSKNFVFEQNEKIKIIRNFGTITIKIVNQEKIGQPRKGYISFKLQFVDEKLSKEKIGSLGKKLLEYESHLTHIKDGSSYEYNINTDDKVINIIIHYPLKKWPTEEQRDIKLINDFADDFLNFYKNEVT